MPSLSHDSQRRETRFREQRWLLDAVIKHTGPEWDQNRLHYLSAPLKSRLQGAGSWPAGYGQALRRYRSAVRGRGPKV